MKECRVHGVTEHFKRNGTNSYRCRKCASQAVTKQRKNTKIKLLKAHGEACVDCGVKYSPYVMQFDHRDTSSKELAIAKYGVSYDTLYKETLKCDLVCANCHAERTHRQRCFGCEYCIPL